MIKYYLVYGCYLIECDNLSVDFIKQYYHTKNIIELSKIQYEKIYNNYINYIQKNCEILSK